MLACRPRCPLFTVDYLHLRRSHYEREREEDEKSVDDRNPFRGFHSAVVVK